MKVKEYFQDTVKSIVIGFILSGIIIVISGIVSAIMVHGRISGILPAIRSTLCITGAFGLLLSAAMLLSHKTDVSHNFEYEWRNRFKKFNITGVVLTACALLLLLAGGIDYLIYYAV